MQYIGVKKVARSAVRDGSLGRKVAEIIKWPVVLVSPGEEELTLLADLSARRDSRIVAVIDPDGLAVGTGLAEGLYGPVFVNRDLHFQTGYNGSCTKTEAGIGFFLIAEDRRQQQSESKTVNQ